jgi:hypothetical protein
VCCCEYEHEPPWEISWLAGKLLVSEEGLCSMGLVSYGNKQGTCAIHSDNIIVRLSMRYYGRLCIQASCTGSTNGNHHTTKFSQGFELNLM